ncbi:ABC transporter substrate-binding protein [Blautia sp. HCP3S3_H10_1]|uniref:ABC transporter substrate-binding protein n=1 Tax=unclassified Blautia TaxID=2648079 RepID=UPI003F8E6B1B|nr:ABC transporter substrate-binding protein [Clostridia bacterium]
MQKYKKTAYLRKKTTTYLISAFGAVSLGFSLSGCAGIVGSWNKNASSTEEQTEESAVVEYTCISNPESEKKIYVILKNYHGAYWKSVIEGISDAAKEMDEAVYLGGIDNETDISGQISLVNQAMEQGANGILLAPANSSFLVESCEKAYADEIPLVLIDSSINSTEYDACYMTDNIAAGKMAAEEILEMLNEAGNSPSEELEVGILLSSDTSQAMVNRISGFLDYWTNYAPEKWGIAQDIRINGGSVKKAQSDAEALLKENEKIKGFFGCNNTSTVGIVNTLLAKKRSDVAMVGFDLADETKEIIENPDYQAAALLQKQDQMGYLGMHMLDSFIKGEKSQQKYFDTGVTMIDQDYLMENEES